jgi:hypothetical protein
MRHASRCGGGEGDPAGSTHCAGRLLVRTLARLGRSREDPLIVLKRRAAPVPFALAAALAMAGCGTSMGPASEPPPPATTVMPSKYTAEEIVGRWGFTSYHNEADRARTETAARAQCRQPYIIAKGPGGGVMMHLADQSQAVELRLKGSSDGRNYIGLPNEPGGSAMDREIISFDGRVMITRFVDPDAGKRYGNMVYVRCAPRA